MSDEIRELRDDAERFRRLARVVEEDSKRRQLLDMAAEFDRRADALLAARGS